MERFSYHLYCWLARFRRRVRLRFTPAGLVVLVGMLLTGLLGIDTEQSLAYQIFALLCGFIFVAALCTPFFRGRFTIRRLMPRLASVGERFAYTLCLTNQTVRVATRTGGRRNPHPRRAYLR
jgi:hypothetical protein